MAKVEIVESLSSEINKEFKKESIEVLEYLRTLETSPSKGKELGVVGGLVIKELRYKGFRFYFITDGLTLRCMDEKKLIELLLLFVRMSDKKAQQETIEQIKHILKTIGPQGFQ
ncbi:hypothetical protein HZA98_03510 [Candidatus Woesearchaeota archaeon]|nr:hypothetical protein [Candidatus Woesearchaeota archaeon]